MSTKNSGKDSSEIQFDTRTKAVMTTLPHHNQAAIKEKISAVKEVLPKKSNHEIALVLQYYEYNVGDTIAAFMEDGAVSALKAWNYTGSKPTKKKNKKKNLNKAANNAAGGAPSNNATDVKEVSPNDEAAPLEVGGDREDVSQNEDKHGLMNGIVVEPEGPGNKSDDNSSTKTDSSGKIKPVAETTESGSAKPVLSSSGGSSRSRTVSLSEDSVKLKNSKGKKNLDKSIKELMRHALSFQRSGNLLNEEMEKSQKRLHQSFKELRQILDERELQLTKELANVKHQATELLGMRQDQASKLKMSIDRADVMTDVELNELRIDIKHFVSERKFDDELWRTVRFVRDHDKLIGAINAYGEVTPVTSHYTQRRQSVSSTASSVTQGDGLSAASISAEINNRPNAREVPDSVTMVVPDSVITLRSTSLSPTELAELQQKLQESLRLQGLPSTYTIADGGENQHESSRMPASPSRHSSEMAASLNRQGSEHVANHSKENDAQLNGNASGSSFTKGQYRPRQIIGRSERPNSDSNTRNYRPNNRRGNPRFPQSQGGKRPVD